MQALLLLLLLLSVIAVTSAASTPWFLRGTSIDTSDDIDDIDTATTTTPYDDLITCMWNGTTVTACHSLNCKWCHSTFSDVCVTDEFAANLDGSVFHCDGDSPTPDTDDDDAAPVADDDATPSDDDTDDDSPPDDDDDDDDDDITTVVPTPAPTTIPPPTLAPDDIVPIDDDDPNHTANDKYMEKLLHCMSLTDNPECSTADLECTWCTSAPAQGMCFSHQAAKAMAGPYYQCNDNDDDNDDDDNTMDYTMMMEATQE